VIRVKFMARGIRRQHLRPERWLRQFPGRNPVSGDCLFLLDCDERDYDWLVVYSEFPPVGIERFSLWREVLSCPKERTIFIMNEPASVKSYGTDFLDQFGWVITSQEPQVVVHPGVIRRQSGYRWFYGADCKPMMDYDAIAAHLPIDKTRTISTVCSAKRQTHTLHATRYDFTQRLKGDLPALDIFGRGVCPVDDKSEALDSYKYHIVIENHVGKDHWSEKLSDVFLGLSLPFYHGCPNAADYFPQGSMIPIDIRDYEGTLAIILGAIESGEFEKRLPDLLEARRRVMEEHQIFAMVAREVERRHHSTVDLQPGGRILSRQLLRRRKPWIAVKMVFEKMKARKVGG